MQPDGQGDQAPARAGAAVVLRRVVKTYGRFTAVHGLDLDIEPGEFITLLGPSGSGKSTTLMMIAGFETPSAGEILVAGRSVVLTPPNRRNIGMVFQNYALFPHMTVADNIAFPLRQRRTPRAQTARRVREALEMVQLQGLEARFPQQLSGGQQQRVAIARATIFSPPVLLMDEPLSALDKQLREGLLLEIKRLHATLGITFIYVTHDQREALVMSDRVAVMNNGRIEQIDTPRGLYDRPANRFVASFVGETNFFTLIPGENSQGCGHTVSIGREALRVPAGSPVGASTCMIRPEKIIVRSDGSGDPAVNALRAVIRQTVFMGDSIRYIVEAECGNLIAVKRPHRAGEQIHEAGAQVMIEWAVADTRLL